MLSRFSKLNERFVISGLIVTETPLMVGSGREIVAPGEPTPVMKSTKGVPYIPGSTIKGVIRSQADRLLRSFSGENVCENRDCDPSNPCKSCNLFGSLGMASKVIFRDAIVEEGKYNLGVRTGIALEPDTKTTKMGAKYDIEFVDKGAEFQFEIVVENPSSKQLGLLFASIDAVIALGGGSTRGLGKISFNINSVEKFVVSDYFKQPVSSSEKWEGDNLTKLIQQYKASFDETRGEKRKKG